MFTRLFNQSLPAPTEEQTQTMLFDKEIGLSSEIISAAFEPRFKLYALGSATGDLHVINEKNHLYSYIANPPEQPVLKIIPLTNSSTFLSVSSYFLYENHCFNIPRQQRQEQINNIFYKKKRILSEVTVERGKSFITHWIVTQDGKIFHRTTALRYNIIDCAASPLHPEFVLLLDKDGMIYGFSVEKMGFTELCIDFFKGKDVHSIICPFDMKFYICHSFIEKLDLSNKEVSKGAQINALQVDFIDEKSNFIAAINSTQKNPSLFKGNRPISSIENLNGGICTCVSMINDKDWTSIVHTNESDSIYLNDQLKIHLEGEILVPTICVEYQKPLTREGPRNVTFITSTGRFLDFNGNSIDHFMLKPIEPKFAFIDKSDNIYVFNVKNQVFVFEQMNYIGCFTFEWGKPLAVLNGYALCVDGNRELFIAGIKDNQKVQLESPLLPSPIVSQQLFENYIDFLCEDGKVIRFDLYSKEKFEGEEVVDDQELNIYANNPSQQEDVKFWRPFNGTFACIKHVNSKWLLTVDKHVSNEVCEKGEEFIFFDVIDDTGKVTPKSATYIVTVSTYHVSIFAVDKKGLKRIRHKNASDTPIVEVSMTAGGILMVRSVEDIKLIALPDVSYNPVAEMSFDFDAAPPLVKPKEDFISAPASSENLKIKLPQQPEVESENTLPVSAEETTNKKKDKKEAKKAAKKEKKEEKRKKHEKHDKHDKHNKADKAKKADKTEQDEAAEVDDKTEKADSTEAADKNDKAEEDDDDDVEDQQAPQNSAPVDEASCDDVVENIKAVNPIILPHRGLIIFERNATTIYLAAINVPQCFDESNLPEILAPPPVSGLKKLFGKKSGITLEEADRFFLFNRSSEQPNMNSNSNSQTAAPNSAGDSSGSRGEVPQSASSVLGSMAETQELMQQLLVKAQERSEQLNELEIKAKRLLKTAQKYRSNIRKFHH